MLKRLVFLLLLPATCFSLELAFVRAFPDIPLPHKGLRSPVAMAAGPDSSLFVADADMNRVVKFSFSGAYLGETGGGAGEEGFRHPTGLARRRGFALFVCDSDNQRLVQIDEKMSVLSAYRLNDRAGDNAFSPAGIVSDPAGKLIVFDRGDGEVVCLEPDGRLFPFFRDRSVPSGLPGRPTAVALMRGQVYFSDENSGSLLCFDRFGTRLKTAGQGLSVPFSGLTVFKDSLLLASDEGLSAIRVFSAEGKETATVKTADPGGAFKPGALLAEGDLLFAVHQARRNIVVFLAR